MIELHLKGSGSLGQGTEVNCIIKDLRIWHLGLDTASSIFSGLHTHDAAPLAVKVGNNVASNPFITVNIKVIIRFHKNGFCFRAAFLEGLVSRHLKAISEESTV